MFSSLSSSSPPSSLSMARVLTQSPTLRPQTLNLVRSLSPSLRTPSRPKSSRAEKAAFIEIDIGSGPGSDTGGEGEFSPGVNRMADALHSIYAQRSAPDWLPFIPGSSYWVPPKSRKTAAAAADIVKLIKTTLLEPLTDEEAMSLKTVNGWPSSAYYIEGSSVKRRSKKSAAQSDDEE